MTGLLSNVTKALLRFLLNSPNLVPRPADGISTLYMHMKDINVKVGQKVKQGQIVGTLGKSGRATGPHLDIRLNWFDVKLDPATILN